jgi:hypothetical protein
MPRSKEIVSIELPVGDFIVSNSHGIDCFVELVGRESEDGPYITKRFDASSRQTSIRERDGERMTRRSLFRMLFAGAASALVAPAQIVKALRPSNYVGVPQRLLCVPLHEVAGSLGVACRAEVVVAVKNQKCYFIKNRYSDPDTYPFTDRPDEMYAYVWNEDHTELEKVDIPMRKKR